MNLKDYNLLSEGKVELLNEFPNELYLDLTKGITVTIWDNKLQISKYNEIEIPITRIVEGTTTPNEYEREEGINPTTYHMIYMSNSYGKAYYNNIQVIGDRATQSYKLIVKHPDQNIVWTNDIVHEDDTNEIWTIDYKGFNLLHGDLRRTENEIEEKECILPLLSEKVFYLDLLDGIKVALENEELVVFQRKPLEKCGSLNMVFSENKFKGYTGFNSTSLTGNIVERCFVLESAGKTFKIYHKAGVNAKFTIPLKGANLFKGITFTKKRVY